MKLRSNLIRVLPLMMMGAFLLWSGYYLIFGTNSFFSLQAMKIQGQHLTAHLEDVRTERETLEDRVVRLRPDTLDWDMVEERALLTLGTQTSPAQDTQSKNM